jgi:hypothetical protein
MKTIIELDEREIATIIAALQYWKREGLHSDGHEHALASNGGDIVPLTADEIEDLCKRIDDAEAWRGSFTR